MRPKVILTDRFSSTTFSGQPEKITLQLTRYSSKVISGLYQVGRRTKNCAVIKFYFTAKAKRPSIWMLKRNKGVVLSKQDAINLQDITKTIIQEWVQSRTILESPNPKSHSSLPNPADGIYISQLLTAGHIRRPCIKQRRAQGLKFLCHATIVNPSKIQDPKQLEAGRAAVSHLNARADEYAAKHDLDVGNFAAFMAACFPGT